MSGTLGTINFDELIGSPPRPQPRVEAYSRPGVAGIGAVLHANASPVGQIQLIRHANKTDGHAAHGVYTAQVGSIVNLTDSGISYATVYGWNYLIERLADVQVEWLPRIVGHNESGLIDFSPGARIVSTWQLRAVAA